MHMYMHVFMKIEEIKKLNIPQNPGCYKFLDAKSEIIYIGKAINLRSRVFSYWAKSANHSSAKFSMLKKIKKIEWIETDSEIEALLLEANLIKKHKPQYNVVMRDDKRYVYIKVSIEEKWPRIFMTRSIDRQGKYFGPFTSTEAVRETIKVIRKIWPFRSCRNMPKKTCLYYRIGKCPGVCEEKISEKEYGVIVKQIVLFLDGKKKSIIRSIEKRIQNLESRIENMEKNFNEFFDLEKDTLFLKKQLINLDHVVRNSNILSLVDKYANDVVELAKILGLEKVPERIEGYDISNIFGQAAVGSMVVFDGGEANKSEYKKFKIKVLENRGDVHMLREVLERRFVHDDWLIPDLIVVDGGKAQLNVALSVLKKYKLDILAIGVSKGEGLRSAAAPDKVFFPNEKKPLELPLASPALHIIKRVRDEAHRFAIKYHRQLRSKKMFKK